jgi:hypothetical protein
MRSIQIEHIIDDTSKEIYQFENTGGVWVYTGIYYAHRNDSEDIWGDEWADNYEKEKAQKLNEVAKKLGFDDYADLLDYGNDQMECDEIYTKYNPVCQKTTNGKVYYCGMSWGMGSYKDRPSPKLTEKEIIQAITNQVSKVKIKL